MSPRPPLALEGSALFRSLRVARACPGAHRPSVRAFLLVGVLLLAGAAGASVSERSSPTAVHDPLLGPGAADGPSRASSPGPAPRGPTTAALARPGGSPSPDCNATGYLPPSPFAEDYNISEGLGSCVLVSDYILDGGELTIWFPKDIVVNSSSSATGNVSVVVNPGATLLIGDTSPSVNYGGLLDVASGSDLRLVVLGTLEVVGGAGVWLSNTSSLTLGGEGRIVLYGGQLYTPPGTIVKMGGGGLVLNGGATWSGAAPPPVGSQGVGQVGRLALAGIVGSLQDIGTPIENLTLGQVGNLSAEQTTVDRLNLTGGATSLSFSGFFSRPEVVSNLSAQAVGTFRADDAVLEGAQLTTVGSLLLGNITASPDLVDVSDLTVARSVVNLTLAHASVSGLGISTSTHVVVVNSTFSSGASVTQAEGSFTANGSSHFGFPLVFNNAPRVVLTNVTCPEIEVTGLANVTVNNWPSPTVLSGATTGSVPGITVLEPSVGVQVNRYLIVSVAAPGGVALPANVVVTVCNQFVSTECTSGHLNAQGDLGTFLPTDDVTLTGVDRFVGSYVVTVAATGYAAQSRSVQVTTDDQKLVVTLSFPVVPSQLVPLFAVEIAGVAGVVGAIVYLRTLTRRLRKPRTVAAAPVASTGLSASTERGATAPSEGSSRKVGAEEEKAPPRRRRGPAREWRHPSQPPKGSAPAARSADGEPGKEAEGGDDQ